MKHPLGVLKHAVTIYSTNIHWKPTKAKFRLGTADTPMNKAENMVLAHTQPAL